MKKKKNCENNLKQSKKGNKNITNIGNNNYDEKIKYPNFLHKMV